MAVVGAGSLCAGNRELPRGVDRQYNLIVIEDDFARARVHVREMAEGNQFTRKRNGAFLDGYAEVSWQPPTQSMGGEANPQAANEQRAILEAEAALHRGNPDDAEIALSSVDVSPPSYARKLLVEVLRVQRNWERLREVLQKPNNVEETVTLVVALVESDRLDEAQARLNAAAEVDVATRADLQGRIDTRRLMKQ